MKKKVGKRKRKGWRKKSPICTLCTTWRWLGNSKERRPFRDRKKMLEDADLRI